MSNVVTKTKLNYFAGKLWNNKIKPIKNKLDTHNHDGYHIKMGSNTSGQPINNGHISLTGHVQAGRLWVWSDSSQGTMYGGDTSICFNHKEGSVNKGASIVLHNNGDLDMQVATGGWTGQGWQNSYSVMKFKSHAIDINNHFNPALHNVYNIGTGGYAFRTTYTNFVQCGDDAPYLALCPPNSSVYGWLAMDKLGYFYPTVTNGYSFGHPEKRIHSIFLTNTPNVGSDSRIKKDVVYLDDINVKTYNTDSNSVSKNDIHNFFKNELKVSSYIVVPKNKNKDNYRATKNELNRKRTIGFIAQDAVKSPVGQLFVNTPEESESDIYNYDMGSYMSLIAAGLQEEINLRDNQINELIKRIEILEREK